MDTLFYILISTFLISLIAFVGILTLFLKEKVLNKILLILVAFAAGSLFGAAFFHLLPEAVEEVEEEKILNLFLSLILGFCVLLVLENFINWHHHHTREHSKICTPFLNKFQSEESSAPKKEKVKPFSYLILVADAIHNFIDGLVIAASFVVSFSSGVITALAVALHEIPQEIGDFGVLVYGGFKKIKALFLNFLSAIFAIFGGVFGFFLSEKIGEAIIFLLPFAAGTFIYIAASDLIPEIKQKTYPFRESLLKKGASWFYFLVFLSGISLMFLIKLLE